jgi:hypothetical protein
MAREKAIDLDSYRYSGRGCSILRRARGCTLPPSRYLQVFRQCGSGKRSGRLVAQILPFCRYGNLRPKLSQRIYWNYESRHNEPEFARAWLTGLRKVDQQENA